MNIVCWRDDETGFTLVEMLLALSLIILLLAFFPPLMKTVTHGHGMKEDSLDVTIFLNYLSRDARGARAITTEGESILFEMASGETYLVERIPSQKYIRRLRNGVGHVLMLENVASFYCDTKGQLVRCTVELMNGMKVTRTMVMLYPDIREDERLHE